MIRDARLLTVYNDKEYSLDQIAKMLREQDARSERIDALAVDRSAVLAMPQNRDVGPDMEALEPEWVKIRKETTMDEKVAAWRNFLPQLDLPLKAKVVKPDSSTR